MESKDDMKGMPKIREETYRWVLDGCSTGKFGIFSAFLTTRQAQMISLIRKYAKAGYIDRSSDVFSGLSGETTNGWCYTSVNTNAETKLQSKDAEVALLQKVSVFFSSPQSIQSTTS